MPTLIKRAYRYRFYPQEELKTLLAQTFGCVRFVYNQVLAYSETHYATKSVLESQGLTYQPLSGLDRINYVKILKDTILPDSNHPKGGELQYPWLHQVSSVALQQSARHCNDAYARFFKGLGKKPRFKSKKDHRHAFTITGKGSLRFDPHFASNRQFCLPKYDKPLNIRWGKGRSQRCFNHLNVSSVTISLNPAGQYYISFLVEEAVTPVTPVRDKVSMDVGLKTTAKWYDGTGFTDIHLPALLKTIDHKIRRAQKSLSRKVKGSHSRERQRLKVATLHQKRTNIITDVYHKLSTTMIRENQTIVMEDLHIKGMKKNRKLSRAIHAVAWGQLFTMIRYKAAWQNRTVTCVPRFYPSSKTCSGCGTIYHGLRLKERTWTCTGCGSYHDRDENACVNLYQYSTTVGTTVSAGRGRVRPQPSMLPATKMGTAVVNEAGILGL